jgi:hypothetical protein
MKYVSIKTTAMISKGFKKPLTSITAKIINAAINLVKKLTIVYHSVCPKGY